MADAKITDLTALTSVADVDLFAVVDDPSGTPVTKKITRANVLAGVPILLDSQETDTSETVSSTAETAAMRTYTLAANTYSYVLVEATVRSRNDADLAADPVYTWRIKLAGSTQKTFTVTNTGITTTGTDGGPTQVSRLSHIISSGHTGGGDITITGQMTDSNSNIGLLVHNFRVWGIY